MNMQTQSATGIDFIRDAIRGMAAYQLEPSEVRDKLDQNESAFDIPDELKELVLNRVREQHWNRYPDFELRRIRQALADTGGVSIDNVLVGNGSNELLLTTIATFVSDGRDVIFPVPTFPLYGKLVTICGGTPREVLLDPDAGTLPVDEMVALASRSDAPPLFIICSPNNPTGGVLQNGDLDRLLATGGLVLLDRAYAEFSRESPPPLHERLVTFSTFSKAWGLAGLRIGWLMTTREICTEIRKVKLPYSLNIFSEEAALAVLASPDLMERNVSATVAERERLRAALADINGVKPLPGEANFIAFRVPLAPRTVFEALRSAGSLVRDVSGYPSLHNALRVSVGTAVENDRFLSALKDILDRGDV